MPGQAMPTLAELMQMLAAQGQRRPKDPMFEEGFRSEITPQPPQRDDPFIEAAMARRAQQRAAPQSLASDEIRARVARGEMDPQLAQAILQHRGEL